MMIFIAKLDYVECELLKEAIIIAKQKNQL